MFSDERQGTILSLKVLAAFCVVMGVMYYSISLIVMVYLGELFSSLVSISCISGSFCAARSDFLTVIIVGRKLHHLDDIVRMNQSTGSVHEAQDGQGLGRKRRRGLGLELGAGAQERVVQEAERFCEVQVLPGTT